MTLNFPSLAILEDKLTKLDDGVKLVVAAARFYLSEDHPDFQRQELITDAAKVLTDFGWDTKLAVCVADVVEGLAGGTRSVEHVMEDLKTLGMSDSFAGTVRAGLTDIEQAIQDKKAGK